MDLHQAGFYEVTFAEEYSKPGLQFELNEFRSLLFRLMAFVLCGKSLAEYLAKDPGRTIVDWDAVREKMESSNHLENLYNQSIAHEMQSILLRSATTLRHLADADLSNEIKKIMGEPDGSLGLVRFFKEEETCEAKMSFRDVINKIIHCESLMHSGFTLENREAPHAIQYIGRVVFLTGPADHRQARKGYKRYHAEIDLLKYIEQCLVAISAVDNNVCDAMPE